MAFNGLTSVMPFIKSGRLRVLGVTSIARTAALPEVQTLDEQGLKGFQAVAWNGLTAPARTPKDALAKTADTVARIIKSPEFAEQLKRDGSDPVGSTTAEFVAHLRDEVVKWKKVLDRAGIKSF
jgi:tripartite-type tricarboxylate transporter receptor subunit TctC